VFLRILTRLAEHGVRDLAAARTFLSPPIKETESSAEPLFLPLLAGF